MKNLFIAITATLFIIGNAFAMPSQADEMSPAAQHVKHHHGKKHHHHGKKHHAHKAV